MKKLIIPFLLLIGLTSVAQRTQIVQGAVSRVYLDSITRVKVASLATGSSYVVLDSTTLIIYTNTSTLASATLTFPPSPTNGRILDIHFIGDITSFTLTPNTGQAVSQPYPVTTISAGDHLRYMWVSSISKWISSN